MRLFQYKTVEEEEEEEAVHQHKIPIRNSWVPHYMHTVGVKYVNVGF